MIRKAHISIPTPCHENWDKMSVAEKGRFCDACQKEVFDFTKSSDREILQALNSGGNQCGRFLNTQLNRELVKPKEKPSYWIAAATGVMAFLNLGNHNAFAQGKVLVEQTDQKQKSDKKESADKEFMLKGTVLDDVGPLPGANVMVKGSETGVMADINGNFYIKAKENDILVFSFIGMEAKEVTVRRDEKLRIILEPMRELQKMSMTVGMIISKRRTFFGRMFHNIGNWFRSEENKRY